jgi:hypothetical protein
LERRLRGRARLIMLPFAQKAACEVARHLPKEKPLGISLLSTQESRIAEIAFVC